MLQAPALDLLNAVVAKKVTVDEVNAAMKAAATESFGYNTEQIVSSDIVGMRFGSLFDATQTMVNELPNGGCQVQVVDHGGAAVPNFLVALCAHY